jgi:hypothetical protein
MKPLLLSSVVSFSLLCAAPSSLPNSVDAGKAELLAVHQAERSAHFAHYVNALIAAQAPDFTDVSDGKIQVMSREQVRQTFTEYFQGTHFSAWDDLGQPIIHVSPDRQMGWLIVRVRIAYSKTDSVGKKTSESAVLAWMSTYEKRNGNWLLAANATTVEP